MGQQAVWHLATPQWKSSSLHQSPSQQCDICRSSADLGRSSRCGRALVMRQICRCCVVIFFLRRTVDPTSGQHIVLDCSSGCSENSTAYLVPWMQHMQHMQHMQLVAVACGCLRLPPCWVKPSGRRWAATPVATRRKLRWLVATRPQHRWSRRGSEPWILPPSSSDLWLLLTSADFCWLLLTARFLQTEGVFKLENQLWRYRACWGLLLLSLHRCSANPRQLWKHNMAIEPCSERFLQSLLAFVCWHSGSD